MSRFSIRIQVFVLAGAFIVALMFVSALSWKTLQDLGTVITHSNQVVKEDHMLVEVQQSATEAMLAVLLYATNPENEWSVFTDNVDHAIDRAAAAATLFADQSKAQEDVDSLLSIADQMRALAVFYEDAESEAAFGQLDTINNEIAPVLRDVIAQVNARQALLDAEMVQVEEHAVATTAFAQTSSLLANGAAVLIGLGLAFAFGRFLASPIQRARDSIAALTARDYSGEVPDQARGDEVGMIARSIKDLGIQLSEAEEAEAKAKAENTQRIALFQALTDAMGQLQEGALDSRLEPEEWRDLGDRYVRLCNDFNGLSETLQELVASLRGSAQTVQSNATELSGMSDEMSRRAEMQAATLEESAAALDELSASVQSAAEKAQDADEKVVEGRQRAQQGGEVMARALEAMTSIAKSSDQIAQIITVIDDIAFQTNLLALNAGVEAARAGESGKGFSVVASEVRGLAQRASESANEIKDLVLNSVAQIEDGERLVKETSETLTHIVESVTDVSSMVAGIAAQAQEQAKGVREINVGVGELDKVTQQNAAMVGETSSASQQLTVEATRLSDLLTRFSGVAATAAVPATDGGMPELFGDDHGDAGTSHSTVAKAASGFLAATAGSAALGREADETAWENAETFDDPGDTMEAFDRDSADDMDPITRETLVHGSWAAEMGDPDPLPMEAPQDTTPEMPPRKLAATGTDDDDAWADF